MAQFLKIFEDDFIERFGMDAVKELFFRFRKHFFYDFISGASSLERLYDLFLIIRCLFTAGFNDFHFFHAEKS